MKRYNIFLSLCVLMCAMSCGNRTQGFSDVSADSLYSIPDSVLADTTEVSDSIQICYAKGLRVSYEADGVHVFIFNPASKRQADEQEFVVKKPSRRFVCTTALQVGNFEALGLEPYVVGMNSLRNLFSPKLREQLETGQTEKVGREGNFDAEKVIALRPDYIFVSASKHGGYEVLRDCGIPLVTHHGYKETHPLGQAEWIKLVGLLTGEVRRANAVFNAIEQRYLTLRDEVQTLVANAETAGADSRKPTVLSGRQLRDGWYVMGGKSYMAQIFADAGADYLMADVDDTGGVAMDFEAAYARGIDAEFWQIDGAFDGEFTLETLAAEDSRYADIAAFKQQRVLFCNLSATPYRELSPVEPHILLADFVKAFHPSLLPHYTPKFYKVLKH